MREGTPHVFIVSFPSAHPIRFPYAGNGPNDNYNLRLTV